LVPGNALGGIPHQLHNEAHLSFPEQRLDYADDPGLAADLDSIADLERLLAAEVAGRDHLVAAANLIAVVDPSHRGSGRYA
jgi:hypothetical protein